MESAKSSMIGALSADAESLALQVKAFQVPSNTGSSTSPSAPDLSTIKLIDYDFKNTDQAASVRDF